jgi:hypothetical protein
VIQQQKWFGHLSGFGDEGGMPDIRRNLKSAIGGWL